MTKVIIALSALAAMSTIALAQPKISADEAEVRRINFRVNVRGDSAVVVDRLWMPSKKKGGERTIFTNFFVKRDGQWRIAELISQPEIP